MHSAGLGIGLERVRRVGGRRGERREGTGSPPSEGWELGVRPLHDKRDDGSRDKRDDKSRDKRHAKPTLGCRSLGWEMGVPNPTKPTPTQPSPLYPVQSFRVSRRPLRSPPAPFFFGFPCPYLVSCSSLAPFAPLVPRRPAAAHQRTGPSAGSSPPAGRRRWPRPAGCGQLAVAR